MSLGSRIRTLRLEAGLKQREVAEGARIAVSYLSRVENGRIVPGVQTLEKISEAMFLPITAFFDDEPPLESGDRCPVSLSGRCILDQVYAGHGRRPKNGVESYTQRQLETLRLCNYLLHSGSKEIQAALSTMVRSLVALADARQRVENKKPKRG